MIDLKSLIDNFESSVRVLRSAYFCLDVKLKAKQSTSFGKGHAFTPPEKRKYLKELVKLIKQSYSGPKFCGLIRITLIYSFPWRKIDKGRESLGWVLMSSHVDLDNLHKPVLDALEGILFNDDCKVVVSREMKIRSSFSGVAILVDEIVAKRT